MQRRQARVLNKSQGSRLVNGQSTLVQEQLRLTAVPLLKYPLLAKDRSFSNKKLELMCKTVIPMMSPTESFTS